MARPRCEKLQNCIPADSFDICPLTYKLFCAKFKDMKNLFCWIILISLIAGGCAGPDRKPELKNSLSPDSVKQLWGDPQEIIQVGKTNDGYPVEVWEYRFKKDTDLWVLIFVDSELYFWAKNDPEKIFEQLITLGVYDQDKFELLEKEKELNRAATQAEENRKTMEIIRTYQFYENIKMQIQTQQIMQTIQRQQLQLPPNLPPPPPAKPPMRQ
jgi:hypothetical protein